MTEHLTFILDKEAKNTGGDKYHEKDDEKFIIYIPQYISRKKSETAMKQLKISIS